MSFSFDPSIRMYKHNLEMLNAALDTMKLSEIEIKNIQGYVVTRQNFNIKGQVSSTNQDYGIDKIDLICKQRLGKDLHIFQVDTAAFPRIFTKIQNLKNLLIFGTKNIQTAQFNK